MAFKVLSEDIKVNVAPVDSIGGAKPEAEERPAAEVQQVENFQPQKLPGFFGKGQWEPGKGMFVAQQTSVAELSTRLGKMCGRCKHFRHGLGQQTLEQMKTGTPDEQHYLRQLRGWIVGSGKVDFDFYGDISMPDEADKYVKDMGLCAAYSAVWEVFNFVHPHENCPSEDERKDAQGNIHTPELFEALDSRVEKVIQNLKDELLMTAAGKK